MPGRPCCGAVVDEAAPVASRRALVFRTHMAALPAFSSGTTHLLPRPPLHCRLFNATAAEDLVVKQDEAQGK